MAVAIAAAVIISVSESFAIQNSNSIDCKVSVGDASNVKIETTLEELAKHNIEIGDCVDVEFPTGYNAEGVAFVRGDYLNAGDEIIVANENTPIYYKVQNFENSWHKSGLDECDSLYITISLVEKGKFNALNSAFALPYNVAEKNLRSLRGGHLRYLDLFRGSNPDTSGDYQTMMKYYYRNLSINNKLNLSENAYGLNSIDLKYDPCNKFIIETLWGITNNPEHFFIYSNSDDFTAYFCAICEAIGGASYNEIVSDYMESYKNLYGITAETTPAEYNAIKTYHIDKFLHMFTKTLPTNDLTNYDFGYAAELYLRAHQLNSSQIAVIKSRFIQN